jgi:N-acylneuraminate cytidylyltransferase
LRSVENAGHHATTVQVRYKVLAQYRKAGRCFDLACCLYPTAAFVRPKDLSDGRAALMAGTLMCFMPVAEFDSTVWQSLRKDREGKISPNFSENVNLRT